MKMDTLDKINLKLKIARVKNMYGGNIEKDLLSVIEDYNELTLKLLNEIKQLKGE